MNTSLRCFLAVGLATALVLAGCTSTSAPSPQSAAAPTTDAALSKSTPQASITRSDRDANYLTVCSFNIKWLGQFKERDNVALADLLAPYDIVVVQELIAPPALKPTDGAFRQRAAAFFKEMGRHGFSYHLAESGTGNNATATADTNTNANDWWVTFFRADRVVPANDLPHGFIDSPVVQNPVFDRVPYALGLRSVDGHCDFVLLSVHLHADKKGEQRRANELGRLATWIHTQTTNQAEKDFIVLGDMNLQNRNEYLRALPSGFASLNDACLATNVSPSDPRPYDQVMFDPTFTSEIDRGRGIHVIKLIEALRSSWHGSAPYPGDPYNSSKFALTYSDHNPVVFRIKVPDRDDD